MQVFVPYDNPMDVAQCLDKKRLSRQITEAKLILDGIDGKNGWGNNIVAKMWKPYKEWLNNYWLTLKYYYIGDYVAAANSNIYCLTNKPDFLTQEFCDQHKRRLYTKNPIHYSKFRELGESYDNWYYLNNQIKIYNTNKGI